MGYALHPDKQTAATPLSARPTLNVRIQGLPPAEIEISHAKIRAVGDCNRFTESGKEIVGDVVEDAGH